MTPSFCFCKASGGDTESIQEVIAVLKVPKKAKPFRRSGSSSSVEGAHKPPLLALTDGSVRGTSQSPSPEVTRPQGGAKFTLEVMDSSFDQLRKLRLEIEAPTQTFLKSQLMGQK